MKPRMNEREVKKLAEHVGQEQSACGHESLAKEYYLGSQTGDYLCGSCGRAFTPAEAQEIERRRGRHP